MKHNHIKHKLGLGALIATIAFVGVASAGWRGIFNEAHVSVDGATVTRVVDVDRGTVCYVATGHLTGFASGQGSQTTSHVVMQCFAGGALAAGGAR